MYSSTADELSSLLTQKCFHRLLNRNFLLLESEKDTVLMKALAHHSAHALALYTWMLHLYMNPCTGCCDVTCLACMCFRRTDRFPAFRKVRGDNCCMTHEAALLKMAGLEGSELVYASFANDIELKPYAIIVDHRHECIVISIRGTLSIEDFITDGMVEPVEMTECGERYGFDGSGRWAHGGILASAVAVRSDIQQQQVLQVLLQGDVLSNLTTPLNPKSYSSYSLHLVGHSLGAGAAILLGLMMKNEFPALQVFGYGTPAGLLDSRTVQETRSWIHTVVLADDLVPRLTIEHVQKFRNEVLDALARARINKNRAFTSMFESGPDKAKEYLYEHPPPSPFNENLGRFMEVVSSRTEAVDRQVLMLAGQVVYLPKTEEKSWCLLRRQTYTPVWAQDGDLSEILVSSTMIMDHFPDKYYLVLQDIWESWRHQSKYSDVAISQIHLILSKP